MSTTTTTTTSTSSTTYPPLIATPLPFPTLSSFVSSNNSFATETGWMIVIIVVHIVVFGVFIALLAVYMCCIKPEGKGIVDDDIMDWDSDEDVSDDEGDRETAAEAERQPSNLSARNKYMQQDSFGIRTPIKQQTYQQGAAVGVPSSQQYQ